MSLRQTVYFMSLVGGLAGLLCWVLVFWIPGVFSGENWLIDMINAMVLGGLIGGLIVGFSDHWSGDQVVIHWVLIGVMIGLATGGLGGLIGGVIHARLAQDTGDTGLLFLSVVLSWMIIGAFLGLGIGLRWVSLNKLRAFHALVGGLLGGTLGGVIFAALGNKIPDLSQALGFILTGVGIACGVVLAPVLLSTGILKYISSGDTGARNKYGPRNMEWELHEGDRCVIGRRGKARTQTTYAPGVQVVLPDTTVAERHAIIIGKGRRFYIDLHPENNEDGLPMQPLKVRGYDVVKPQELRNGDDIVVGLTLLRFYTRRDRQG